MKTWLETIDSTLQNIKLLIFDFDGVFTDNKVIIDEDGKESVICNRSDGLGLIKLRDLGLEMMILSMEKNDVVLRRAEKLNLHCIHGCEDKLERLEAEAASRNLPLSRVAFVGNDINDAKCLKAVGFPFIVADAHKDVQRSVYRRTLNKGGHGAVREICDAIAVAMEQSRISIES